MAEDFSNNDLMRELGSMSAEMRYARESRGVLHQKLEAQSVALHEVVVKMTEMATNLDITSDVAVQARNSVLSLKTEFETKYLPEIKSATTFQAEAAPILDMMRIVRNIVVVMVGGGVLTVAGVVGVAIWARDALAHVIRVLLGL